jgi:NADH-quinone oxidoreductase subunit H
VGPPLLQNFWDIIKLFGKETIVPAQARLTFLFAPYIGLISVVLVAGLLGRVAMDPLRSFSGDLIVVLYLLVIPAVALILGASASGNPLASVGASREMKLVLAYELPFILAVAAVMIKGGSIRLGDILMHQASAGSNIFSFSGSLAFLAIIFCMQAKIGYPPFDISEAEQEIMAGVLIEYSGICLAVFRLVKAVLLYTMPLLVIILFMGRDISPLFMVLKFLGLMTVIVLIKNTNPRLRIDQAMRFFWRLPALAGSAAVVLALLGL